MVLGDYSNPVRQLLQHCPATALMLAGDHFNIARRLFLCCLANPLKMMPCRRPILSKWCCLVDAPKRCCLANASNLTPPHLPLAVSLKAMLPTASDDCSLSLICLAWLGLAWLGFLPPLHLRPPLAAFIACPVAILALLSTPNHALRSLYQRS
jgi:hypothetical protein